MKTQRLRKQVSQSTWMPPSEAWFCRVLFCLMVFMVGVARAGTVTYVYTDPQGTPLAEADAQGNITAQFEYTPYGVSVSGMGAAPNGVGYTGHVNDPESGFVYMQARYYDPVVGRFLSVDPVGPEAGNGFNFNSYSYANNNPALYIDPDGEKSKTVAAVVRLVAGGIKTIGRVSQEQAVAIQKARQAGKTDLEIRADRRQVAHQIQRAASRDPTKVFKDSGSLLKDGSGAKGLKHYQTGGEWGHTFFGKLSVVALATASMLDNAAIAAEYLPDPIPRPQDRDDVRRANTIIDKINELTGSKIPKNDEDGPERRMQEMERFIRNESVKQP